MKEERAMTRQEEVEFCRGLENRGLNLFEVATALEDERARRKLSHKWEFDT